MLTKLFFPSVPGVRVERVWGQEQGLPVRATTTCPTARCPLCGHRSKRVHARDQRTIADLPCVGAVGTLPLRTRRFVWRRRWCRRKIFTERRPALVAPSARRTTRLRGHLQRTGFDLGGAPGARHATAAGTPVSRRTLLRLVRCAPLPQAGPVRVLGVDDWAQRRGRTYGTILVHLETHEVIDVLPDRTAATLTTWLRPHPEVEIMSRDRGGAYAEGARQGAPQAVQVAERFHLLTNVTDSFERFLTRTQARLRQAAQALVPPLPVEEAMVEGGDSQSAPVVRSTLTRKEHERQERRAGKLACYEEVVALRGQEHSLRASADRTGLDRRTVRRYAQAEGFPENQPRARGPTQITRFVPYLQERWAAGGHNAKQLWHEIRRQGVSGGYTTLTDDLRLWRGTPARRRCPRPRGSDPRQPSPPCTATARQTLWLLLRPVDALTAEEQAYLTPLSHACPHVALAQALGQDFAAVLREHDSDGLYTGLHSAGACPMRELSAVARGMWLDRQAIEAAVATEGSQGQTEGQVNRLQVIKRGMYGRAQFDLLRQRVLHAA